MSTDTEKKFEVWFVPTEKGKSMGWTEKRLGGTEPLTAEDASYEAHIANMDDPAPDKREYGGYQVREVAAVTG